MLSLYKPFTFGKVFDRFFDDNSWDDLFNIDTGIKVEKTDNNFTAKLDLVDFSEKDINIEVSQKGIITVKASKKDEHSSHTVERVFTAPKGTDIDQVVAELKEGVLTLTAPIKALEAKPDVKQIPITTK